MKTFEEYLVESTEGEYEYPSEMLTETIHKSKHFRSPSEMADIHKKVITANKHKIVSHETAANDTHVITHITPRKRVRVTTIKPALTGRNKTHIHDRPGTPEEQERHGPKK